MYVILEDTYDMCSQKFNSKDENSLWQHSERRVNDPRSQGRAAAPA